MEDRLKPERGSGFPTSGHWILLSPLDQSTPRVGEPVPRRNQPRNQPNSPPRSSGTSSLASNHVRHRPHLQARRAHRAQGLGTRPARIDREPRPRPARLGNAPSINRSLDWIDAPKPPSRVVSAALAAEDARRAGADPVSSTGRSTSSPSDEGDPTGPSGRPSALRRPERVDFLSASLSELGDAHNLPMEG